MRLIAFAMVFMLFAGLASAGCGCANAAAAVPNVSAVSGCSGGSCGNSCTGSGCSYVNDTTVSSSGKKDMPVTAMGNSGNAGGAPSVTAATTSAVPTVVAEVKNKTGPAVSAANAGNKSRGIAAAVHAITAARKSGNLTVPQGMLVRILAHNRVINMANLTPMKVNESLRANFKLNGRNKSFVLRPHKHGLNVTDGNVTVNTNETLDLENESLTVGGKKLKVMPAELPARVKAKKIHSAVLQAEAGGPVYYVNATKNVKFLWIFDADADVQSRVDASTGEVQDVGRPWWSFLAGGFE